MNKNRYSIIIINEKTKLNFSMRLSHVIVKTLIFILLIIFTYIIYSGVTILKEKPYDEQLSYIYNQQNNMIDIIDYLKNNELITDSTLLQFDINSQVERYKNIFPASKPVDGIITKGINISKPNIHNGIDIAAPFKSEIQATQEGIVILSDKLTKLGHTIIIAHPNNYYSLYAHMYKRLVKSRDIIKNKQLIGLVGEAKKGDGPHLHFEIWHNNLIIDPRNLIKEYKLKDVSIK